jgi:hypothetical protein
MSSISSVSSAAGLSDLMQMLSASAPPAVSSLLSSTSVQTALAKSSPADIVQLSDQAMQLQMVSGLFGGSGAASQTSNGQDTMANLFASIFSPSSSSTAAETAQETTNLSMANLLGAIYSPSGTSLGSAGPSGESGSLVNLLA